MKLNFLMVLLAVCLQTPEAPSNDVPGPFTVVTPAGAAESSEPVSASAVSARAMSAAKILPAVEVAKPANVEESIEQVASVDEAAAVVPADSVGETALGPDAGVCNVSDVQIGCPETCELDSRRARRCERRRCRGQCRCCGSTCDMFPHYPYLPVNRGYYYFRPYNWTMIGQHQNIAAAWGLDPMNPYSRELFEKLYGAHPRATATVPPHEVPKGPSLESLIAK